MRSTKYFCKKTASCVFHGVLNVLMCINNCLLNGKENLTLGKLIDEADKYTMSAKNCHLQILIVGIKVTIAKCKPKILGLQSATLTLKWSFSTSYNYISRSTVCKADLRCILSDEKLTVILKVFLHSDNLWALSPSF